MKTTWPNERIERELATRNPQLVKDLRGSEATPAAQAMLGRILATDDVAAPTRPPRRRALAAAVALVVLVVGVPVATSAGRTTTAPRVAPEPKVRAPKMQLVDFTTTGTTIVARITDPLAAASQLDAVFQQHDLDISVKVIPVSPTLVGSIVELTEPAGGHITSIQQGPRLGGGDQCWVGLVIPAGFRGQAGVTVGRAALPGEDYGSSASPFAPGEVLHCSGILNEQVSAAAPVLHGLGQTVEWRENVTTGGATGAVPAPTASTLPGVPAGDSGSADASSTTTSGPGAQATEGYVETLSTSPPGYYVVGATSVSATTVIIWLAPQPGSSQSSLAQQADEGC